MNNHFILSIAALIALVSPSSASDSKWKQWPANADDHEGLLTSLRIPPKFKRIQPLVPDSERTLINGRFRSPDGNAEFAITAIWPRQMANSVKARSIKLPLLPGESVVKRTPKDEKITWLGEDGKSGEYIHHFEDITVEGPKGAYTRYFRIELSTSSLPGTFSMLWEFKAANESARKAYQSTYKKFKEGLSLGED